MILVPITEVCDFKGGTQPPKSEWSDKAQDGYIRMLQIRDFTQPERNKPEYVKDSRKLNKCTANDVLIGRYGASVGKILRGLAGAYNVAIIRAIPDESKVTKCFLYYLFKSPLFQNFILNVGDRAAQAGFNKTDLKQFKIPLLSLDDQKRINHLLGKVESLINERKQSIQQLDDLLKSVFLDMFGDPVGNDKGWDILPCDKVVINIQSGTSYGGEDKGFLEEDELGVLKISAVTKGQLDKSEFKAVKKTAIKKKLRFIKKGDLLFSRANTVELVAACCVVYENSETLFLPDKIWALTLSEGINIQYFNYLLKNEQFRNNVRSLASGGHDSMLNISMKNFRTLEVPNPDEKLQNYFASIVGKVTSVKSKYKQGLSDLENLYGALSQKAFKGELNLSNVPLPDESEESADNLHTIEQVKNLENNTGNSILGFSQFDPASVKDNDLRKRQLNTWFAEWLEQYQVNSDLNLNHFWQCIEFTTQDYLDDNDEPLKITLSDYEHIKDEVFKAIKSGVIKQTTDMIETVVDGKIDRVPGNQILLKNNTKRTR